MNSHPHSWTLASTGIPAEFSRELLEVGAMNGFAIRQPGLDLVVDRAEALERLRPLHLELQAQLGLASRRLCLAEQVHGSEVGVAGPGSPEWFPGADALLTNDPGVCLGIYVADCCALYLVDPDRRAIGLIHSGAKGTRLGIVPKTIQRMTQEYGSRPQSLLAVLSPCIRPPAYDVDFAAEIRSQCLELGVGRISDCGICTGVEMDRYYSYRREAGKTGRMLALLALSV